MNAALVGKQQMLLVCEAMKKQMAELHLYIEAKLLLVLTPEEEPTESDS